MLLKFYSVQFHKRSKIFSKESFTFYKMTLIEFKILMNKFIKLSFLKTNRILKFFPKLNKQNKSIWILTKCFSLLIPIWISMRTTLNSPDKKKIQFKLHRISTVLWIKFVICLENLIPDRRNLLSWIQWNSSLFSQTEMHLLKQSLIPNKFQLCSFSSCCIPRLSSCLSKFQE